MRNAWIVLSTILDSALEYGYLTASPARGVKFPADALRREPEILTPEELARLLLQLREPVKTMVTLAAITGFRVDELLALRWRATDLKTGTVRFEASVYEGQIQRPKSERGNRVIPIGPVTRLLLEAHRRRSVRLKPEDFIFPNRHGGTLSGRNLLQRVLAPATKAVGLGRVIWHQFRHIHFSVLHDLGVPAKVVQGQNWDMPARKRP